MGNICCTNPTVLSPDGKYMKSFSAESPVKRRLIRNLRSFNSLYEIEKEKLGFGSYGDVKLCRSIHLETRQAVKILNKDYLRTANIEHDWFTTTIDLMNKLDHPLIIRFHEYFEERDFYYLLMDYHQEGDLLRQMRSGNTMNEQTICAIIKQVLIAVAYMHVKKVAHRDVKPENILLSLSRGVSIKLIDFDTAASFEENCLTGALGTHHYMAPETVNSQYDEKCDIWSCGIIMFMLLTGKNSLPGLTDKQNPSKVARKRIDLNCPEMKNASAQAKDLVKLMLQREPHKRINALEAISHPWFNSLNENYSDETHRVLEKIRKISNSPLKKAAKKFLYNIKTSVKDIITVEKVFLHLDKDFDGELTSEDFLQCFLEKHRKSEAEEMAQSMMGKFDCFVEGRVKYSEFVEQMVDEMKLADPRNLRYFFELMSEGEEWVELASVDKALRMVTGWEKGEVEVWTEYFAQYATDMLDFEQFSQLVVQGITY
jgi:calcium-dependent protein kinase